MTEVFSKQWFTEHQDALLRFANSKIGRRTLRIHGKRSGVGNRRIISIEPHAITWDNEDGTYSLELRTHNKYAKRLYHAFKPLWWTLHGWDMGIANRLAPGLNAGFDTLNAAPLPGSGGTTMDGWVERTPNNDETFATIIAGAGTDHSTGGTSLQVYLEAGSSSNKFDQLDRSIMTFDTSIINPLSTIQSASLSLYVTDKYTGLGSTTVNVTGATPAANNKLTNGDFQQFGSVTFASTTPTNGNNTLSLNSSGIANITKGGISAFGLRLGWDAAGSFTGTWSVFEDTYYNFASADSFGSSQDPTLTVTYTHVWTPTVAGTLLTGGVVTAKANHATTISGTLILGATTFQMTKQVAPVAGKEHLFFVYDASGNFIRVWPDVISVPEFTQRINTPGTTMTVTLGRNANTTIETRSTMATESGVNISTEAGADIAVDTVTNNTVGAGTDVMENYFVDCYVYYGTFDDIATENGQVITAETGEDILFPLGAPLGKRIFSGWIMDYSANYGDKDGVDVTIASNGSELANTLISSGSATTVSYSSLDPGAVFRSIMSMNTGKMTYTNNTVLQTGGTTISPTYRNNTILEGIEDVYNRSPDGWYWYGNLSDNNVYFQQKNVKANHTFILGKHIQSVSMKKSIEQLKNLLYFVGGDPGTGIIYKKYTGTLSVTRTGLDRQTDNRVTSVADALAIATKTFARYQNPIYSTTLKINSGVYDIESIQIGHMVTFANFGNFIDGLLLQVISLHYTTYTVELELGEVLDKQIDIVANLADALDTSTWQNIPSTPS